MSSPHHSQSPCCLPGGTPWLFPEQSPPLAAEAGCLSLELEARFWETDLKMEEQIPFCWGGWLLRVSSGDLCKPEGALGSPMWRLLVCALCFCYMYSFCQGLQVP